MSEIIIDEKLIIVNLKAETKEEALKILADNFYKYDYVKDGYYENVIKREKDFPTGLPTIIPVAICHTEAQYVKQGALAMATLAKPIPFGEMGTPDREISAEIIFLLALNDPKDQVPWLKKMVTIFKSKDTLLSIKNETSRAELANLLNNLFYNETN